MDKNREGSIVSCGQTFRDFRQARLFIDGLHLLPLGLQVRRRCCLVLRGELAAGPDVE